MRRIFFLPVGLMLSGLPLFAQESQWANEVIEFSSELSAYEYAAQQVLGKPNVLPNPGDNPNEWLPKRSDRVEYIKVGFENPMKVQQIAIAESYNPGAVTEVYLYDVSGNEYLINTFNARPLSVPGRMLNIYIDETEYQVKAARVVIDGSQVPGFNGIDAIGISGTKIPLMATQELAIISNPTLSGEVVSLNATGNVSDTRPVFVKKFNTLYFTRAYHPDNLGTAQDPGDIWMSIVSPQGTMEDVGPIGEEINNYVLNTACDYDQVDGRDMFLFGNISGDVNRSDRNVVLVQKNGDQWEGIQEQKIRNDFIVSFNADFSLASEGKVMFISTIRYDTEGGRDIYISHLENENRWTEPINLGRKINTAMDEFAPFYAESESALYFSTAGFAGFGEGDIYRVVRLDSTWNNWSTPVNLGPDINSSFDEKYYYFDEQDNYSYFARNDEDSIYHIIRMERPEILESTPLVVLQGNVIDMDTGKPISSEITFQLVPGGRNIGTALPDAGSGGYEIQIPSGYEYQVSVMEEGYEPYMMNVFLENRGGQYVYEYDVALSTPAVVSSEAAEATTEEPMEMEAGRSGYLAFGNVFFEFNAYIPKDDASFDVIYRIVEFLKSNEDYKVEITGFTDPVGNKSYNQRLSQRRAERVKRIMVEEGISARRIVTKGLGVDPSGSKTTDLEKLEQNRRVEFNFIR
ncbi:MAG: OmpA family protein [Cyclobacteriaceae bacterium]|nr:OmpA family protein [Cyclobacteriaceae bacterium]